MSRKLVIAISIFLIIMLILGIVVTAIYLSLFNDTQYTIIVAKIEQLDEDAFSIYGLLRTGGYITLKDTKCKVRGKLKPLYSEMKIHSKYVVTVIGLRLSSFNTYQNIISIREVT